MSYETGTSDLPPVTDWVNDWDWLDPQWGANAIDIWNSVREVCPVATTEPILAVARWLETQQEE